MTGHQEYREWSAAYVLGALDLDDRAEFQAHLATCDECRDEVVALAAVPGLLHGVDHQEGVSAPDRIADMAADIVDSQWRSVKRSRRRWRWATGVAATVAAVSLVLAGIGSTQPGKGAELSLESPTGAIGLVLIETKSWGTAVGIEIADLPSSDRYIAWAVSEDGAWEQMAAWGPTPNNSAVVNGASSIPTENLASVVITTGDRSERIGTADRDA